jgi:hypothetical protein
MTAKEDVIASDVGTAQPSLPPTQDSATVIATDTGKHNCHCEERSDAAIQIASSFLLAMTAILMLTLCSVRSMMHHREHRGPRGKKEDDCGGSLSVSSVVKHLTYAEGIHGYLCNAGVDLSLIGAYDPFTVVPSKAALE